ncbi:MAG TPA: TetR/AcrR family transcriptional regulator [Kofleriaceae bacterium]
MASSRAVARKPPRRGKVEPTAPVPRKRRRPSESKKKPLLVETALSLFMRYGMNRVSIGEVCEQASVSKFTFYKYFTDKVDLAKAAITLLSDRVSARIDEIVAMPIPLPTKVAMLVEERVRMAREWSPELIHDIYHADAELAALFKQRAQQNVDRYVAFVRSAQATGEMRPEIHPEVLLAMLDRLYELGKDDDLVQRAGGYERLTRSINNVLNYGLLTRD